VAHSGLVDEMRAVQRTGSDYGRQINFRREGTFGSIGSVGQPRTSMPISSESKTKTEVAGPLGTRN
jgi:hypothetical protein